MTAPLFAQAPQTGVAAHWDVQAKTKQIATDIRKLEPLVTQAKPETWVAKGAPAAYVQQLRSAQFAMTHLLAAADALAADPERLSAALDTVFKMDHAALLLGSLREGVRKYQSPALADQLSIALSTATNQVQELRQHAVELAKTREEEFKVVHQEAQRCRGTLSREEPPASSRRNRKR